MATLPAGYSLLAALETWPEQGIPDRPGAWLMTTARRRAIDLLRRDHRYADKVALLERSTVNPDPPEADDRLRLIFTCCHPALATEAQVALTLRAVAGFTTQEIAAAFLVSEPTMAQRIVRAKRKIVEANIPYRVPQGPELVPRVDAVLAVLYLMFNEGYLSHSPATAMRRDLAEDAQWLTLLVDRLMPNQPEVLGLLALTMLNLARSAVRFDAAGELVLLRDQETDWPQIVRLYDALLGMSSSPVIRLNRAVALAQVAGPEVALGEVNDLAIALAGYHLLHSTRAELLDQLGEHQLAREARLRALELCQNPAERSLLERKLAG